MRIKLMMITLILLGLWSLYRASYLIQAHDTIGWFALFNGLVCLVMAVLGLKVAKS